jgi:hypothetical protein
MGSSEKPIDALKCAVLAASTIQDDPLSITSPKDLKFDMQLVKRRTELEGLSFLTKTLPSLGKALLQGLKVNHFPVGFRGFKLDSDGRPLFLGAYLKVAFDEAMPQDMRSKAVSHILQVAHMFYKLKTGYSDEASAAVLDRFSSVETELNSVCILEDDTLKVATHLVGRIFDGFNPKNISPRHGPGAVATGEKLWEKWEFLRLYNSIHQYYPYYEYFCTRSTDELLDRVNWYKSLERLETGRAKVVLVHKDSRGPRLISAEPLEYQYIQQGLSREIVSLLEKSTLTGGFVNFEKQSVNADIALRSSATGEYATLDLKDASDRVSMALVRKLFSKVPDLLRALEACRTTSTLLPDGRVVEFQKHAPMGSALCFPVMSVCLWALAVGAVRQLVPLEKARTSVYVYGDDVIVPVEFAEVVINSFTNVGLAVNLEKSYWSGNFRESCGMDAYFGVQVTPARAKLLPARPFDVENYAASVALVNSLTERGYGHASRYLSDWTEKVYGKIPYGVSTSAYPCLVRPSITDAIQCNHDKKIRQRRNVQQQSVEVRALVIRPESRETQLDGWPRLLQNFLQPSEDTRWMVRRTGKPARRWRAMGS